MKTIVVTGASTGIGRETARVLAKQGHAVVMVSRDPGRAAAALEYVRASAPGAQVHGICADLSSLAEVRRLGGELKAQFPRIEVLINNAALVPSKRTATADGLEAAFATNCVAPVLLVHLLAETLKASAPARIINFFGGAGKTIDFEDLQSAKEPYSGWNAYGQTKLCDALLTIEMAKRFAGTGVTVNCVWPGLVNTEGMRSLPGMMKVFAVVMRPLMRTPEQGTQTPIYAATAPELEGVTGKFYGTMFGDGKKEMTVPAIASDPASAKRLYEICEKLAGR